MFEANQTNCPAPHLNYQPNPVAFPTQRTPTANCGNRSTTISGFNIPNGYSLLANVHCVTLTRRA
jgi:hypothetical protein